jgi:uracil-DNA glycosylase family protein
MAKNEIKTAAPLIPAKPTLPNLREAAAKCTACPLYKTGTQTVFGEGPAKATIMLIGEVPGDYEDRQGKPFVGPAGKLLDEALAEVGVDRKQVYVTNAVKHFKWRPAGKRRIHEKPNSMEIAACRPWLEAEISLVKPGIIVCLGATAAQVVFGKDFRVTKQRGEFVASPLAKNVMATVHPSSILRAPNDEARQQARVQFVEDLKKIRNVL